MLRYFRGKLSRNQMVIVLAIIIGLITGIVAVILKYSVHHIQIFLQEGWNFIGDAYMIAIFPMLGILLTVIIVHFFFKDKLGRGISNILYEIAQKSSFVPLDKTYSQAITSAITVGFGGSAGLEAPIVVTGSAIGSNISKRFHLNYKDRTLLLASGAAAGISAVFNAPITGAIFAIEVLLTEVAVAEFIPIIIASVSGALLSKIILGEDILFIFKLKEEFNYFNVPFYILLGLLSGITSLYYSKITHFVETYTEKYANHKYLRAIIGGLILSGLYLLFPSLFGEGYHSVKLLANGEFDMIFNNSIISNYLGNEWFYIIFIGMIAFFKVFATAITIGSGGNGGNFAPSLFVGAYMGFFFSQVINKFRISELPVGNFTLVGMAGILSGVFYAPFTGIFLIAEITGGYELILPLMLVSAFSFLIVRHFEPYSMDTKKLARKGKILTENKDKNILTLMRTSQLIETNIKTIEVQCSLRDLIEVIKETTRNTFAVVNITGQLVGIIDLFDVRDIMFCAEKYDQVTVKQLMKQPESTIRLNENMKSVMRKFDISKSWILPIVDEDGLYVGFVSKSNIFTKYRKLLKEM